MPPKSWLALLLVLLVVVPTAVIAGTHGANPPAGMASDSLRNGPPLYAPDGHGAFPAEGSIGSYNCAQPAKVRDIVAGLYPERTNLCVENALVVANRTERDARNGAIVGSFTLEAPTGETLNATIGEFWWMHGTPALGMTVVVVGNVSHSPKGGIVLSPITRWVDLTHPGLDVDAWRVAAGLIPEGTYVWVNYTTIYAEFRNNDGPNGVGDDPVETGTMCPTAHLTTEVSPPYFGLVTAPPIGATVRLYGAVRYDDGHGWWEIHPIRAWEALDSKLIVNGCPSRLGESGTPPPGFVPNCLCSPVLPAPKKP